MLANAMLPLAAGALLANARVVGAPSLRKEHHPHMVTDRALVDQHNTTAEALLEPHTAPSEVLHEQHNEPRSTAGALLEQHGAAMGALMPDGGGKVKCEDHAPAEVRVAPVKLVVLDFDETLTLATYQVDYLKVAYPSLDDLVKKVNEDDFRVNQVVRLFQYNFGSSYNNQTTTSRVEKLKNMLGSLRGAEGGTQRVLAVLTHNSGGVHLVLNWLRLAGLDTFFSAVWCSRPETSESGFMYKDESGVWSFSALPAGAPVHKADFIEQLVQDPSPFFPGVLERAGPEVLRQMSFESPTHGGEQALLMQGLQLQNVVLVDDDVSNFKSPKGVKVPRHCLVARYRVGKDTQLSGGIGAHDVSDYKTLVDFVDDPSSGQ